MSRSPRKGVSLFATTTVVAILVAGCVQVPQLQPIAGAKPDPTNTNPKAISINEVVKRVKCEIWDSIKDRPENKYPWFNKWVAQADLTLTVNDSSAINPGATITSPLGVGSIPGKVTNMGRSFSVGLGGGVSTTTYRTEIVSFSISIPEIRKEFAKQSTIVDYNGCNPFGIADLTGNLGLKDWVDSAFGPIDNKFLRVGNHNAPKGPPGVQGGAPPKPGAGAMGILADRLAKVQTLPEPPDGLLPPRTKMSVDIIYSEFTILTDALKIMGGANDALSDVSLRFDFNVPLTDMKAEQAKLTKNETSKSVLKTITGYIAETQDDIDQLGSNHPQVLRSMSKRALALVQALAKQISQNIDPVISTVQLQCDCYTGADDQHKLALEILQCLKTIQNTVKLLIPTPSPTSPPIDAISHQVNFVISWSASANPTWTFIRFKGPTPSSGSFMTASESNTHNLTIVIGNPGSPAVTNARSALTFSAALATQLAPQLTTTPSIVP
jgi:hypothetical protein